MSFSDLLNMVQSYAGVDPKAPPESTTQDFHNVTQAASHDQVAGGLSEVFRSNQTPPFGEMLAGILGQLIQSAGPGLAGSVLGQYLPGLAHGNTQITPEQAQQVPPEAVQDLAKHAEKNDPSIVDQASQFYAQHPQVVQALGAGALAMILNHMSKRR
jgi:hypothetical protein